VTPEKKRRRTPREMAQLAVERSQQRHARLKERRKRERRLRPRESNTLVLRYLAATPAERAILLRQFFDMYQDALRQQARDKAALDLFNQSTTEICTHD
jgi:hypothetical protein